MFQVDAGSSWLRLTAIRIPDGTDTYEGIFLSRGRVGPEKARRFLV